MFPRTLHQDSQWPDNFEPSGLQLNGYAAAAPNVSGNLRKRTLVRKFLCDQMLRVRERTHDGGLAADKCLTLDGSGQVEHLHKSFSCKLMRTLNLVLTVVADDGGRYRALRSPRVVTIEGMSRHTSPAVLIAAISGGPLEKVVFHRERTPMLEAHFLRADGATKFLRSSQSGELNVHGRRLLVKWAGGLARGVPLASYIREEIELSGASRVLVLSKPIAHKRKDHSSKRRYPNAADNFSGDLNLDAIKWDFVQFGGIVEVSPVISTKLSLSIQFTDIRSAILAMNTLRLHSLLLYFKYKAWNHRYECDVTNRPSMVYE